MPPRKPKPEPDATPGTPDNRPGPNRTGVPLHIYIPPALRDAIDSLAKANRRTVTAEVMIAMEEHLRRAGRLPDPSGN